MLLNDGFSSFKGEISTLSEELEVQVVVKLKPKHPSKVRNGVYVHLFTIITIFGKLFIWSEFYRFFHTGSAN